nr:Uma2 family endonuclease [Anaerolineae bacterium]
WVTGARTPDVLYYAAERLNAYKAAHPDWPRTPYLLVPDLVVEIMSPTDVGAKIDARIEAYLADGVRLIWLVKPHNRTVVIYTPDDDQPRVLRPPAALAGGAVLPGFTLPLSDLFA